MYTIDLDMPKMDFNVCIAEAYLFLNDGNVLWADKMFNKLLCTNEKRVLRVWAFGKPFKRKSCTGIFKELGVLTLPSIFILQSAIFVRKYFYAILLTITMKQLCNKPYYIYEQPVL